VLQAAYKVFGRSSSLKRTQKGCEDESTVGGPAAMNGFSSEILYLSDPAQGLCIPEGNITCRVNGERQEETRSLWPVRTTHSLLVTATVKQATSEALSFLVCIAATSRDESSMS